MGSSGFLGWEDNAAAAGKQVE